MGASNGLPNGYELRPPDAGEASVVDRLSAAADTALGAPPSLSEDLIRRLWARPRFVLQTDAWIVELQRTVVAYAQVWAEDTTHLSGFALVHPEHTGRGIGTALAALVEGRAAEQAVGDARLHSATIPQDRAAARLLEGRGYTWARRFFQMEVDLDGVAVEPAVPPPGISLRPLDPERDLPAAHRVLEEAFEDHWDYTPTPYREFLDRSVHREDFQPGLWVVAVDARGPVGVLSGSTDTERGLVGDVGVLRAHRGRGIATAMLRESFARFLLGGRPRVRLNVDSDNVTGAVSVYERVGMRVASSYDLWARTIRGVAG